MAKTGEIGARMKYCRKKWGITQKQISEYLGVKQGQISKLENGSRTLRYPAIDKLVLLFGVNYDWFVDGIGESGLEPLKRCEEVNCDTIASMNKIINNIKYLSEISFRLEVQKAWKENMVM